jgi:peptidoglycan/xylan/chitin deacetylase (PgdA/CDA1 family)
MTSLSRHAQWLHKRSPNYVAARVFSLFKRYGLTTGKAENRVQSLIDLLDSYGCHPTFATPGRVVNTNPRFFQALQSQGAEIAMHGYDHVDFKGLSRVEAARQFSRSAEAFRRQGIRLDGFRCPYLSYTDELLDAIPSDAYKYSSNKAIWWNVVPSASIDGATAIFASLNEFYRAASSDTALSIPRMTGDIVEIPPSIPDDIQLFDGLQVGEEGIARSWHEILLRTHQRGELFVLLFHPELSDICRLAFRTVLTDARRLQPAVWITQLRDVSDWWRHKSNWHADIQGDADGLRVHFTCPDRATVLIRHLETSEPTHPWHGGYDVLESRRLQVAPGQRPFVGVAPTISEHTKSLLKDQGYIVDDSEHGPSCGVYLDAATSLKNDVQLIDLIESSPSPLVRFWRWPDEARSALCVTGDLDALSLFDYASRIFTN